MPVGTNDCRRAGGRLARLLVSLAAIAAAALPLAHAAAARAAELRIAVAVPLSGADAGYGEAIRQGAELAAGDGNAASQAASVRVRILPRDDGGDPAKAVALAKRLVAEAVPAVIGGLSSAAVIPASAVYGEAGVVDVVPAATAPLVTERGLGSVFRLAGRDDAEPATAVRLLLARHVGRVAVVHDRTSSGKGFADAVRAGLARAGVVDVLYGSFDKGARDLAALAARIRASGAQVVVFGGGPGDGGQLIRLLRDAGSRAVLLGSSALASDDFAAAGGVAADGSMLVFPLDPRARPAAAELLRRLRGKGGEPDAMVFYGYAAVQLLQQASEVAGSLEPARIAAALHGRGPFNTVLGPLGFDGKGDRIVDAASGDAAVYVWHKGAAGRMAFDEQARF